MMAAATLNRILDGGNTDVASTADKLGLHTPSPVSSLTPAQAQPPPAGSVGLVKPVRAIVFSPGGAADNPNSAGLAIDGDPTTAWSTDTYFDGVPFPTFKPGVGLLLQLPKSTAITAVTVDLNSTGTVVQIRSSASDTPAKLDNTAELTPPTPMQPGHNTITVTNAAPASNVLVWISTLGNTGGKSQAAISEITLRGWSPPR
jgi:putative peptidoglycan lipid II flippase